LTIDQIAQIGLSSLPVIYYLEQLFSLQLAFDSGAKKVLLPMSSAVDIPTVPAELFTKFQVSFYSEPVDAVYKALGVN